MQCILFVLEACYIFFLPRYIFVFKNIFGILNGVPHVWINWTLKVFYHATVKYYFLTTVTMERKSFMCLWLVVLLILPDSILTDYYGNVKETKKKAEPLVNLPIRYYTGLQASAKMYAALVAAYGIDEVTKYGIRKSTVSCHLFSLSFKRVSIVPQNNMF